MGLDDLLGFIGISSAAAAVEKSENQLTFVNFIVQAQPLAILTYKKGCETGWLGQTLDKPSITEKDSYFYLHGILVNNGIIESKVNGWIIITFNSSYTVTDKKAKLSVDSLKNIIKNDITTEAEKIKKCYEINYDKLSEFLINYNDGNNGNKAVDQVKILTDGKLGGKKRRSTIRRFAERRCKRRHTKLIRSKNP
jgi:hypothetical protein